MTNWLITMTDEELIRQLRNASYPGHYDFEYIGEALARILEWKKDAQVP